jgi:hypothetical protein
MNADAGGFLAQPPGWEGSPGLGIAGIHGVPRARTWDVVVSAAAPELVGESVTFHALPDGTLVVEEDGAEGSLGPLADAIEETLRPPYRAAAVRRDGDVWAAVAEAVRIVELPQVEGDVVELNLVGGERELAIDGVRTIRPLAALDALAEPHRDVALRAERVDGSTFAVDLYPL